MLAGVVAWQAIGGLVSPVLQVGMIGAAAVGMHDGGLQWAAVSTQILRLTAELMLAWVLYRQAIAGRLRCRPGVWVAIAVTAIVVGFIATQFSILGMTRLITPSVLGRTFLAMQYLDLPIRFLLPTALGALAIRLGRTRQNLESC
jgi:hypothetical protein